ncbi:MAG: glycosyltransferase family 2 protein [Geminicoccaceae bacterium]|nr:glycosyltransferase family 2 protein [Geminicoccaceae bacterium]
MVNWSIVLLARNEEDTITGSLEAVACAADGRAACTVVLHGPGEAASARVRAFAAKSPMPLSLYATAIDDRADAWNRYVYDVRPGAEIHFFVDARVRVVPDALLRLARALHADPSAHLATSAIPSGNVSGEAGGGSKGRIASRRGRGAVGGLDENLYALRNGFVEELVRRSLRLPFGLHRRDGLLGAMAMYDCEPERNTWRPERMALVDGRLYDEGSSGLWKMRPLQRRRRQKVLQARGELENAAVGRIIYSGGFEALPLDADRMLAEWLRSLAPGQLRQLQQGAWTSRAIAGLRDEPPPGERERALVHVMSNAAQRQRRSADRPELALGEFERRVGS